MVEKKKENKTVINNWNFGEILAGIDIKWLMRWFLALIIVSNLLAISSSKVTENKGVYDICMDGCQSDLKIAKLSYDFINPPDEHKTNIAINRVGCIEECNSMYLKLRNK